MDSPRGRIYLMRALDEGRAQITDTFSEHMFRCLDCRACETVCPSGVHFGQMMEDTRAEIVSSVRRTGSRGSCCSMFSLIPGDSILPSRLLQFYQHTGLQSAIRATGLLKLVAPGMAKAETLMPELPIESGVDEDKTYPAEGERVGTVAFFTGCVMNSMLGSINRSSVRLLNAAGYDVVVPTGQVCCSALANHAGIARHRC